MHIAADPKAVIGLESGLCSMAAIEQIPEVHAATVSGRNRCRAGNQVGLRQAAPGRMREFGYLEQQSQAPTYQPIGQAEVVGFI